MVCSRCCEEILALDLQFCLIFSSSVLTCREMLIMRKDLDFSNAISLIAGWLHLQSKWKWKPSVSWFKNAKSRLNHHLSGLFGVSSLAWTGHLIHVAIPASRGEYVRWSLFCFIACIFSCFIPVSLAINFFPPY